MSDSIPKAFLSLIWQAIRWAQQLKGPRAKPVLNRVPKGRSLVLTGKGVHMRGTINKAVGGVLRLRAHARGIVKSQIQQGFCLVACVLKWFRDSPFEAR